MLRNGHFCDTKQGCKTPRTISKKRAKRDYLHKHLVGVRIFSSFAAELTKIRVK